MCVLSDTTDDIPIQGLQRALHWKELIPYLQERCAIPRLLNIIASGFFCDQTTPWTHFMFQGIYDPRLFIFIFDFALDFEETSQKKCRLETI